MKKDKTQKTWFVWTQEWGMWRLQEFHRPLVPMALTSMFGGVGGCCCVCVCVYSSLLLKGEKQNPVYQFEKNVVSVSRTRLCSRFTVGTEKQNKKTERWSKRNSKLYFLRRLPPQQCSSACMCACAVALACGGPRLIPKLNLPQRDATLQTHTLGHSMCI